MWTTREDSQTGKRTQEADVNAQIQSQLDQFLAVQREERRRWQWEMENRIDRQFWELRSHTVINDAPGGDAHPLGEQPGRQPASTVADPAKSLATVDNLDSLRIARNHRQRQRSEPSRPMQTKEFVASHTARLRLPNRASNNAIYARSRIN